ncbi:Dimethyl sulfoxide reductase DmsA precursor [Serratia fonticola]|uniref:Dimethyl sulfoxide reductase DmsA n=1 Tax=Serratia fonticola TaxID=47917 RepID=A0A4U9UWD8_SERFO|nr:Dimethyl sulfoxide reductase DmsA precursor [Serratia fonticola]
MRRLHSGASQITGIPAERIIKLAREIGSAKPAYISQGWGPQRQANGELTSRAIAMLPILTGNVGINGGNSGARESTYTITIETDAGAGKPGKNADFLLQLDRCHRPWPGNDRQT